MVLRGHKYGMSQISLVASDVLVTVGDSNDRGMLVWEVVSPRLVSANMKKAGMILGVCKVRGGENELKFLSYGTFENLGGEGGARQAVHHLQFRIGWVKLE